MSGRWWAVVAFVALFFGVGWGALRWSAEEEGETVWVDDEFTNGAVGVRLTDPVGVFAEGVELEVAQNGFTEAGNSESVDAVAQDYAGQLTRWLSARGEAVRDEQIGHLIEQWVGDSPEEALNWLEGEVGGLERAQFIVDALRHWSTADLPGAAGWVAGMADDQTKQAAVLAMVGLWPGEAREEAIDWVETALGRGPIQEAGREALFLDWAAEDWDEARRWFDEIDAPARTGALTALLESEGVRQPERAAALLEDERESPAYAALATAWLEAVAAQQPAEGLRWLNEQVAEADGTLWSAFIYEWAQHEPASALEALQDAPVDAPREDSHFTLFLRWAASDAAAASERLVTIQETRLRDAAVEGFSTGLLPFDPETSLVWASAIENDDLRSVQRRALLDAWADSDPQAAARWLETSGNW